MGKKVPKTGLAQRVRDLMRGLPPHAERRTLNGPEIWSPAEIARPLGVAPRRVREVLRDMLRREEIRRTGLRGGYVYDALGFDASRVRETTGPMLRAMHVKHEFTPRDIALLSDVRANTVRKRIRVLMGKGEVEFLGWRRLPQGGAEQVFRVVDRDGFYLRHVLGARQETRVGAGLKPARMSQESE